MATFDAVTQGKQAAGTSLTVSHTVSANPNRVLIIFAAYSAASDAGVTLSCTYGGTAMTTLRTGTDAVRHSGDGTNGFIQMFIMIAPPTGTANVVLTASASGDLALGAMSFSDARQTLYSYVATHNVATAVTTHPYSRFGADTGALIAFAAVAAQAISGVTQTSRFAQANNNTNGAGNLAGATAAGATPDTGVAWQFTTASGNSAMAAVEIRSPLVHSGNAGFPQIRSTNGYQSPQDGETSATVPLPVGWQPGDLCYIAWTSAVTAGAGNAAVAAVSGWQEITLQFNSGTNSNSTNGILRRVLQAGDTSVVINHLAARFAAVSIAITGYDPNALEDAVPMIATGPGYTDAPAPSITPAVVNDLLLAFFFARTTSGTFPLWFSIPAGMSEVDEATSFVAAVTNSAVGVSKQELSSTTPTGEKLAVVYVQGGTKGVSGASVLVRAAYVGADLDLNHLLADSSHALLQENSHHILINS